MFCTHCLASNSFASCGQYFCNFICLLIKVCCCCCCCCCWSSVGAARKVSPNVRGWACVVTFTCIQEISNCHINPDSTQATRTRLTTTNSALNWVQLTDHELFTVLKSTHCLLNVTLSCSLIIQSCSELAGKGLTTEALFYRNKRLTRRFYRISE